MNTNHLEVLRQMLLAVAAQFIGGFRGAALEKNSGMTNPIPADMLNVSPASHE
jgi:hypothetical protein